MTSNSVLNTAPAADDELIITRIFHAPRALVWEAWTSPVHIVQWWGPRGFSARVPKMDLRTGGQWRYVMVGPDGAEFPISGIFREVVPQERIVTTDEFDKDFEMPGAPKLPQGIVVTALFDDLGDRTRLTLRIRHATPEDRRLHEELGVVAGWRSSFDCLAELLMVELDRSVREQVISISRIIPAPRNMVFEAWTDQAQIGHWWGPTGFRTTTFEMNVRPGGTWRFIMHGPDGTDYKNQITYLEVEKPKRLVYKHDGDEDVDAAHFQTVVTFDDLGGQTQVTLSSVFESASERERVVRDYGAIEGGEQTLGRLAEHVEAK